MVARGEHDRTAALDLAAGGDRPARQVQRGRTGLGRASERIALVVGPEGGLTVDEAGALAEANARLVTLGPRILRTENAAFAAASALLWHHGLFG